MEKSFKIVEIFHFNIFERKEVLDKTTFCFEIFISLDCLEMGRWTGWAGILMSYQEFSFSGA